MRVSVRLPMSLVAALVLVLNLADAVFTLVYVRLGLASEANPFMKTALGSGPVAFMALKLGLVSLCVLLLQRLRERQLAVRAADVALVGSAVAYATLLLYHLSAVGLLSATS
jgi:hypothetical protein